jgi:hypothetical protein
MSTLSPERWRAVSPCLDRALTPGEEERALGKLQDSETSLRAAVEQLDRTVGPQHPETLKARKFLDTSDPSK